MNAIFCTYATWFARPAEKHAKSLLDLPVSQRCMHFKIGCHRLPRDVAAWASVPRLQSICIMCQHRTVGDEKHLVIQCPALQDLQMRDQCPHLFKGTQADAMLLFLWRDDMIGVLRFIDEYLERILYTSISPEMAGKKRNESLSSYPCIDQIGDR